MTLFHPLFFSRGRIFLDYCQSITRGVDKVVFIAARNEIIDYFSVSARYSSSLFHLPPTIPRNASDRTKQCV